MEIFHRFHGFISVDEAKTWTPQIVEQRLIESFEVELAMPGGGLGGSVWSRSVYDEDDIKGWDNEAEFERAKQRWENARMGATSGAITRAEEASYWPMKYIKGGNPRERAQARALQCWALCKASHKPFIQLIRARHWKERTVERYRKIGAQTISDGLARDGVRVREAYSGDQAARSGNVLRS